MRAISALLILSACGGLETEIESEESALFGYENREAACGDRRDNDGDGYFDCQDFGCRRYAFCRSTRVRIAAFNVQSLEYTGSSGFAAVRAMVQRIGADVICLEEVEDFEGRRLATLAAQAGYPYYFMGEARSPMAGGLTNACLSRYPLVEVASLDSEAITGQANANEIARDLVEVRLELIAKHRYLTAIVGHLKSGFANTDKFRRQVEAMRIRDRVRALHTSRPDDAIAVMGDFNEEIDGNDLGWRFFSLPSGLPSSYRLGSDITFPLEYQPFEALLSAGLSLSDPTHEDTIDEYATRIPSGRRIDFVLIDGARITADGVYESCVDDGIDDAPRGNFLRMTGSPLSCGTNSTASDHRPVVVDVSIDP
jgi:endonuclease/exonuclease/phosphatase family metal-dependent hydrolase